MAYKLGTKSKSIYITLDSRLQRIIDHVLLFVDVSLVFGYRSDEEQDFLFDAGKTKARGGESLHNRDPSHAVDIIPYGEGLGYSELGADKMKFVAGLFLMAGLLLDSPVRWGGDWDGDGTFVSRDPDESFNDVWHLELVKG